MTDNKSQIIKQFRQSPAVWWFRVKYLRRSASSSDKVCFSHSTKSGWWLFLINCNRLTPCSETLMTSTLLHFPNMLSRLDWHWNPRKIEREKINNSLSFVAKLASPISRERKTKFYYENSFSLPLLFAHGHTRTPTCDRPPIYLRFITLPWRDSRIGL